MPIYEYSCTGCGGSFERLVKSSGEEIRCPRCGGARVSKLFSAFAYRSSGSTESSSSSKSGCGSCTSKNCSHCS